MSDLVGIPEDRFSLDMAPIISYSPLSVLLFWSSDHKVKEERPCHNPVTKIV